MRSSLAPLLCSRSKVLSLGLSFAPRQRLSFVARGLLSTTIGGHRAAFKKKPFASAVGFSAGSHRKSNFGFNRSKSSNAKIQALEKDQWTNLTPSLTSKIGTGLHRMQHHPLTLIKDRIHQYFSESFKNIDGGCEFSMFDDLDPCVTTQANFDDLLIPKDHVSRSKSDTYYYNKTQVLRTHTSAHQTELLQKGYLSFLATGDCYRRDEIDSSHYPVFHQMEGVRVFAADSKMTPELVVQDLKKTLEGMVDAIFGPVETRWIDAYFPFTHPSLELEIYYQGRWLEVLGSGVIQSKILESSKLEGRNGWAFGLGLERLAMVLFNIPDIRLFWSNDERFLSQFSRRTPNLRDLQFEPFSKYPPCLKDVSMWMDLAPAAERKASKEAVLAASRQGTRLTNDAIEDDAKEQQALQHALEACDTQLAMHDNDFYGIVREAAGDWVEKVEVVDEFAHPKTGRHSKCFRIIYRSLERTLTNDEVNKVNEEVRKKLSQLSYVELR